MTQLYSYLVKYGYSTTYLCLVLAVLCSLVVAGFFLHCLLHCTIDNINGCMGPPKLSPVSHLMYNLASVPFYNYGR